MTPPYHSKYGFKNIRRQTPTRPQKLLPETQVEKTNQDTKPEADFTILATRLKEINFTNMSNSAKQCILQKVTELQNKGHHLERLQRQHNDLTITMLKYCTIRRDVLNYQELEDLLNKTEKVQEYCTITQTQQWKIVSEIEGDLKDILREISRRQTADAPEATSLHSNPSGSANKDVTTTLSTTQIPDTSGNQEVRDCPNESRPHVTDQNCRNPNPLTTHNIPVETSSQPRPRKARKKKEKNPPQTPMGTEKTEWWPAEQLHHSSGLNPDQDEVETKKMAPVQMRIELTPAERDKKDTIRTKDRGFI